MKGKQTTTNNNNNDGDKVVQDSTPVIPTDVMRRILCHATARVQRIVLAGCEQSICVRWKYGKIVTRLAMMMDDNGTGLMMMIPEDVRIYYSASLNKARLMSFSRNYIHTDCQAFNSQTGQIIDQIEHDAMMTASIFTLFGGFVTGHSDGSVRITGHLEAIQLQCGSEVTVIQRSSNGDQIITGSENGQCHVWMCKGRGGGGEAGCEALLLKGSSAVTCIGCGENQDIAVGFADGQVSWMKDGRSSGGGSGSDRSVQTGKAVFALSLGNQFLFSGHEDGKIRLWSGRMRLLRVIQAGNTVTAMSVLEELLAVGLANGVIELYNWQTSELLCRFTEHCRMVTQVMVIEPEQIVSCSLDGTIRSRTLKRS